MTEKEFLALPPEEQAAIVAEHVMGYTWWIAPSGCRYLVAPEDVKHVAKHTRQADGTEIICRDYGRDVPRFLTDIAAAWRVFEHNGYYGNVAYMGTDYGCTLHTGFGDGGAGQSVTVQDVATAQLAICLAALKAAGAIKEATA